MPNWKKVLISALVAASLILGTALMLVFPIVFKFLIGCGVFGLLMLLVYIALYEQ